MERSSTYTTSHRRMKGRGSPPGKLTCPLPLCTVLCLLMLVVVACSPRGFLIDSIADTLGGAGGGSFSRDPDPEFVGQALPFALKTMESLHLESPDHVGLLLALTSGFTQYSYAYVQQPAEFLRDEDYRAAQAELERARAFYLRARDYGLDAFEIRHPGFRDTISTEPKLAIAEIEDRDMVPLLYWTAAAWAGAISLGKDRMDLIGDIPSVEAMMRRALELDEDFAAGALHEFFVSFIGSGASTESRPGDLERHFERTIELAEGRRISPWVTWAETVSVARQDHEQFIDYLDRALGFDLDSAPQNRLANEIARQRALWLKSRVQDLFLIEE